MYHCKRDIKITDGYVVCVGIWWGERNQNFRASWKLYFRNTQKIGA